MASQGDEQVVLTPKKKTANSTTLMMERKLIKPKSSAGNVHIAGGSNAGIVVNKESIEDDSLSNPPHLCLEFRVFLVNKTTGKYTQEKRIISYWFKELYSVHHRAYAAQEFFKALVSPTDFPRDYVGFIKKIMKLMQHEYPMLAKIEVQLTQEKEMDSLPNRPMIEEDMDRDCKTPDVTDENVLEAIEEAYPNSLTIDDMSRRFRVEKETMKTLVLELVSKQLVKAVGSVPGIDTAATAYRRVHGQNDEQVTVVKQMPRIVERSLQPTIAVITAQYHEKMAVDAVMTNKQTFVRYATVGEANVYTLGDLGAHRVVTTKLPMNSTATSSAGRDALIATGSSTTRLLGTFQRVEHVFLVGVGGAVPHYTDFDRHVRKGDVVVAAPRTDDDNDGEADGHGEDGVTNGDKKKFIYQYCQNVSRMYSHGARNGDSSVGEKISPDELIFETKTWCPPELGIQEIAKELAKKYESNPNEAPWLSHFNSAANELALAAANAAGGGNGGGNGEAFDAWRRPHPDTDKLYMSVGGGDVIEVGHPQPKPGVEDPRNYGEPKIHLGPVGAGRKVALEDRLRQEFARRHGIICFDLELDAVVESIYGNRKDNYTLIRGIADYRDGSREREWQNYASLMAAAVLRAIVEDMDEPAF